MDGMCIHPLLTTIAPPRQFTYPFCYQPHPLCVLAATEVQREIAGMHISESKMFGVLVVSDTQGRLAFLAAYSGLLEGRNDWPYFVPPVFDAQQPDGHFKITERQISAISQQIRSLQAEDSQLDVLRRQRKRMSEELQLWLFRQYRMENALGETKDLVDIWRDYHSSPRIQQKYPLPPGGSGDCCAPKLLQYAYQHHLQPLCMAEFWWETPRPVVQSSPVGEIRHHLHYYPACQGKCKPILAHMLKGLDVEANPMESAMNGLLETVYEDESLVVVNKPTGMLSIPGKGEQPSVYSILRERYPDAEEPMIVHRLDLATSGLLVVAKTKNAHQNLQRQFYEHTVVKRYIAIVEGVPVHQKGTIVLPMRPDPLNRPYQVVDMEHGKQAITDFEVLSVSDGQSRVVLYPHTGRTHQLRVHCAHPDGLHAPIVGDHLYGTPANRLYLHAEYLEFTHPVNDKRLQFYAEGF